jgi:hypothetical protein
MADISINPVTRRVQYTGNTGLGPFAFTFNILADADIAVYKNTTLLTLTSEYTVSTNADGTGSITLSGSGNGTALISSDVLTIIGARQLERTTDFVAGGDFFAASINEQLDSQVIMSQQLDEKLSRTLKVNPGDEFVDLELPLKSDRASKYLGFNIDGDPVAVSGTSSTYIVSAFGETLIDDANAAAALVTLGLSATASELNIMDGVTATTAEINHLDGLTSDAVGVTDTQTLTNKTLTSATVDGTPSVVSGTDDDGTFSSGTYTPTPVGGNFKKISNAGAFIIGAPVYTGDYTLIVQVTNASGAGAITFSGFSRVAGDTLTTTVGHDFFLFITKCNGFTSVTAQALQ